MARLLLIAALVAAPLVAHAQPMPDDEEKTPPPPPPPPANPNAPAAPPQIIPNNPVNPYEDIFDPPRLWLGLAFDWVLTGTLTQTGPGLVTSSQASSSPAISALIDYRLTTKWHVGFVPRYIFDVGSAFMSGFYGSEADLRGRITYGWDYGAFVRIHLIGIVGFSQIYNLFGTTSGGELDQEVNSQGLIVAGGIGIDTLAPGGFFKLTFDLDYQKGYQSYGINSTYYEGRAKWLTFQIGVELPLHRKKKRPPPDVVTPVVAPITPTSDAPVAHGWCLGYDKAGQHVTECKDDEAMCKETYDAHQVEAQNAVSDGDPAPFTNLTECAQTP